jgi:hypothetical protein
MTKKDLAVFIFLVWMVYLTWRVSVPDTAFFPKFFGNRESPKKALLKIEKEHRRVWWDAIAANIDVGQTAESVEEYLAGNYFYKGVYEMGGTGIYYVYYRIDDFITLKFRFDRFSQLTQMPEVWFNQRWKLTCVGQLVVVNNLK